MGDLLRKAGRNYLYSLQKYPLRTKAITAGCIAGCSQTISQKIAGAKKLDYRRIALVFLYGLLYAGPFGHYLHKILDYIFKRKQDTATIAKKVALEQAIAGPWNNFIFMVYFGLVLEGRPWTVVKSKIKKEFLNVQLNAWKIWPLFGFINFKYVPIERRVLFNGLIASCWGIFLSLKSRTLTLKAS